MDGGSSSSGLDQVTQSKTPLSLFKPWQGRTRNVSYEPNESETAAIAGGLGVDKPISFNHPRFWHCSKCQVYLRARAPAQAHRLV